MTASVGAPVATPVAAPHRAQPPKYTQPQRRVSKAIGGTRTDGASRELAASRPAVPRLEWKSYSVRRGDTLGKIFQKFSVDVGLASKIADNETGASLTKLMPGHGIRFGYRTDGSLAQVRYELSRLEEIRVGFTEPDGFTVDKRTIPTQTREHKVSQSIGSSLFVSASEAGLSDRLIMELVSIFGWDIDFALDIRSGDRFSVLYEELIANGKPIGAGDIVAAEFENNGTVFQAVRYIDEQGNKDYYDLEGNNLRGTFLRTPVRVSRITSGFSKRRYHPILKKWRAHRGVDYGAPTGTEVLATADGRVTSVGRNGGYGKTIVLKHGGKFSTLYAHLSGYKKGLKSGATVRQGDVIGYVGSTGLATGPHLHYEFRVDGVHRNPLTYDAPKAPPIAERYREDFLALARERMSRINDTSAEQLASR